MRMADVLHNPRKWETTSQTLARMKRASFEQAILRRAADLASRIETEVSSAVVTPRATDAISIPIVQEQVSAESIDVVATECQAVFVTPNAALDLGAAVDPAPRISIERVQRAVASEYGVTRLDLLSSRRTADIVRPRQIAMYLARELTPRSMPEIGRHFGGRDHTTILHAHRKIGGLVGSDPNVAIHVDYLKAKIAAGAGI